MDSRERQKYKRLAVVVDTFPRWSERFIARELQELRRRGVDLTIFCLKAGTDPAADDLEWNGLIERRVVLPGCILPRGFILDGDPEFRRRQEAARNELGATYYSKFGCALKFADLLRDGKFQHVHAHFASLPSTIGWLAAIAAKVPFSMSVHARDLFVEPQLLNEKAADAKCLFTCHRQALEELGKMEQASAKTVLMHHGLPMEHYRYKKLPSSPEFIGGNLIAAGRFVPKKGFRHTVSAMLDQRLASRNISLTLIGAGPELQLINAMVKELKLDGRVKFVQPGETGAIKKAFESAHAFLAPYEVAADGDRDGIPNVILEAFAYHLPVIGTDAGNLSEALTVETGFVVPQKNPAALAEAVVEVLEKPAVAYKRACAARDMVEKNFDIRKNITPLLDVLSM